MNKLRLFSVLLLIAMLICALTGCACRHEWTDANCKAPKTCNLCGQTEGEKTENHVWEDATTEAPKTCSVCGKTEGEKINVDPRFKTAKCKEVFGTWEGSYEMDAAQMGLTGLVIPMKLTMVFTNDGKMEMKSALSDPDAFEQTFTKFLADLMYQQFAALGMSKAEADSACKSTYGKDVNAYCAEQAQSSIGNMSTVVEMVYYVDNGKIYAAEDWDEEMDPEDYEMKNGKLLLDDSDLGQIIEFSKVEK